MAVVLKDKNGNKLPVNLYTATSEAVKSAILDLVAEGKLEIPYISSEEVKTMCLPLYNKKWLQIGDSNTNWFGTRDDGTGFMDIIKEKEQLKSVTNNGTAGATWHVASGEDETTTANSSAVGKVNQLLSNVSETNNLLTDYDVITIMMGTNDSVLGTYDSTDVTTMCGAMHYCLSRLCYYYRKSAIGIILPPQKDGDSYSTEKNELIKKIAGYYGVPVLDAFNECRIIPSNKTIANPSYLGDSVHVGANGILHLARIQGAWLRTI